MKTFREFILEAYDPDVHTRSSISNRGQGGRVGTDRKKTEPEKRRMKAAGGGTTAPAKSYKDRKDIGTNKPKSRTQQQPEKERGTAALSPREAQRKAAKERRAAKAGVKTKSADELLSTKKKSVDPNYKPVKASGLTTKERKSLYKKGERTLRDIRLKNLGKKSEKELKHKVTSK